MASCTVDTTCHTTKKIQAGIAIDSMFVWNADKTAFVSSNKWDKVSVRGIGSDSMIYNASTSVKMLSLTLRADTNVTQFEIEWKQHKDTLSIQHINDYQYVSLACGCNVYHVIDSVWTAQRFIKKAFIVESDVQAVETGKEIENVRLIIQEP